MKQAVCILIPVDPHKVFYLGVSRRTATHLWGLPGGKVDPGETPMQAVIRETKEETGLDVKPEDLRLILQCATIAST